MSTLRPNRRLAEQLAATADAEDLTYSPDGFTPLLATIVSRSAYGELRRAGVSEPTSWIAMSNAERARVRPHQRQAGPARLRLVRGKGIERATSTRSREDVA